MPVSLRRRRVTVYAYGTTTSPAGTVTETYTRNNSTADDRAWWGSKAVPTGRETTLGAQGEHVADAVFCLSPYAGATDNGLLKDEDGRYYKVTAVLPRDYGTDEVQVLAVYADDAQSAYAIVENP